MKKRTLILATGALLVTGGTTVYASSTSEVDNQNESGYLLEENNPHRNQNERRNGENIKGSTTGSVYDWGGKGFVALLLSLKMKIPFR